MKLLEFISVHGDKANTKEKFRNDTQQKRDVTNPESDSESIQNKGLQKTPELRERLENMNSWST